jgi:hypothetical protein
METFALRDTLRDAKTMEEVEAVSDKLLEYNRDLNEYMRRATNEAEKGAP